jgi:DNA polymerase III epsilon subunit-like protein
MKYVSIDIETSGLDVENNEILSIGVIIEDTEKKLSFDEIPKFKCIIVQNRINGSPRAITMNSKIIQLMSDYQEAKSIEEKAKIETISGYKFLNENNAAQHIFDFLYLNGYAKEGFNNFKHSRFVNGTLMPMFNNEIEQITINVAGKNFGTFDKLFLEKLPWWQKLIKIRQRIIDPSVLYCDWINDNTLPSLSECKERLGINNIVTHDALEDAWDVILLLRKFY